MEGKILCDDFLKNRRLTNLRINDSRTRAVYFVNTPDLASNKYIKTMEVMELGGYGIAAVEPKIEADDFDFFGDDLYILEYRGDSTTIYSYEFENGELSLYCEIPFRIEEYYVDEGRVYFTSIIKEKQSVESAVCGTVVPFYQESLGYSSHSKKALFAFDTNSRELNRLSALNFHLDDLVFDMDNHMIAFTAFNIYKHKPVPSDIYTYDLDSRIVKKWTNGSYRISYIDLLFPQKIVFMGLDINEKKRNDNQNIYLIDMVDGSCKLFREPFDKSNEFPGITSDSRLSTMKPVVVHKGEFYFVVSDRFKESLNKIDRQGNLVDYDIGLRIIDDYKFLEEAILLIGLQEEGLHELYLYDGAGLRQLTKYNDWFWEERRMRPPHYIKFDVEGVEIDGWVISPLNFNPQKKHPGVLVIHGGPKSSFTSVYDHTMQLLAANGYFVFYSNPQGSDGRGDKFLDIRGSFGYLAYRQLMHFVDRVLEEYPQIDENYLGVMGHSYGGYLTNYIITRTGRFKAAVSESSISNLVTAFTSSDIGYQYIYEYMGEKTPWSDLSSYIESSPITQATNVSTPTLFIHGTEDGRCNYTESLNMYGALNYHGIKTKLCLMEGEGHNIAARARPRLRKHRYKEILKWFDEIMNGE
ncbi:MAG: S9 family peptidase [Tissierellaceae bacterium]